MSDTGTRKVIMRNVTLLANGETATLEATDHVPADILDAYLADARTRWQFVTDDDPDDDYDGEAVVPAHLEGKSAADFEQYGDATTPRNALDESLGN